jgi:nucleoside-diphosphate-sugar epimerase
VGGGSRVTVREVLALLADILGRPVEVRFLPAQAGDVRETGADLRRSAAVLRWRPSVSLEDGLRAQVHAALAVISPRVRRP